jgi:hypothetical protein
MVGVVAAGVGALLGFGDGRGERLAHLLRHQPAERLALALEQCRHRPEQLLAHRPCRRPPPVCRVVGPRQPGVDIRFGMLLDVDNQVTRGRVDGPQPGHGLRPDSRSAIAVQHPAQHAEDAPFLAAGPAGAW